MSQRTQSHLWMVMAVSSVVFSACAGPEIAALESRPETSMQNVTVDGEVALHSLVSLGDGHLQKIADTYATIAATEPVRSADWERVRGPLTAAAQVNVAALHWFALPDGSYWTLESGRAETSLADRAYFSRVMAGETVVGELVASRATGRSVAIVAEPVVDGDKVVGVLGASVYLDQLSEQIDEEMNLRPNHVFFSLDATPIVGLHKDPETIFVHPLEEGDPQLERAIREITSREKGVVSYRFRGQPRTIHYRRSPLTGWWYGFGIVGD